MLAGLVCGFAVGAQGLDLGRVGFAAKGVIKWFIGGAG